MSTTTDSSKKDTATPPSAAAPAPPAAAPPAIVDPTTAVPHLNGITHGELQTAVKVLQAVALLGKRKRKKSSSTNESEELDGMQVYKGPVLRPFRKALAGCVELQKRQMFQGKAEEEHYDQRVAHRTLKRQKRSEQALQEKYVANTALRRGRLDKLERLKQEAVEEEHAKAMAFMIPDGHVDTDTVKMIGGPEQQQQQKLLENGIDDNKNENENNNDSNDEPVLLPKMRSCYACKMRFRELHRFYDQLCPSCATLNWEKRHQTADLRGKVAVVTGSRVKIGFQTCLKLLRAGASVVATTRFPNAAAEAYRQEDGFADWGSRLHVYGLDLRDVTGLEAFTRFLKMKYSTGIDVLINNACQTIRRPRGYYVPMMEKEERIWSNGDDVHKGLLRGCVEFENLRRQILLTQDGEGNNGSSLSETNKTIEDGNGSTPDVQITMLDDDDDDDNHQDVNGSTSVEATDNTNGANATPVSPSKATSMIVPQQESSSTVVSTTTATKAPFEKTGISHSAAMSQMIILPEDVGVSDSVLPPGVSDINGQQLDLRKTNSWLLKMEQVSTPELMECMFVNAIAPFVLNSRLKPLLCSPMDDDSRPDRYVINVSAMEGKFYRYKMPNHPHTNMAKAALNMMTRTSAEDLAKKHRIFMNSVDTGWINDENPLERASKTAAVNKFQTPIDEIDAAARILDPIFTGVNGGRAAKKDYGKFLKDYKETEW